MRWGVLILAVVLIFLGIAGLIVVNSFDSTFARSPGFRRGQGRFPFDRFDRTPFERDGFDTEGEMIFFTGATRQRLIPRSGGPTWFQMHGGGCAVCHGPDGRGGRVSMMLQTVDAPDIRYSTLTRPSGEGEAEHKPFTESTLRRAIRQGIEPGGERLNQNMPRWDMSDDEVDAVIDYLRELSEETTVQPDGRSL